MATLRVRRLDDNHDLTFGAGRRNFAEKAEGTAQRVRCRLLVVYAEWFLDASDGVPWWTAEGSIVRPIMGKSRNLAYNATVLKARILESDGVESLNTFDQTVDATRKLTIAGNGNTIDGDVFNITQVIDF